MRTLHFVTIGICVASVLSASIAQAEPVVSDCLSIGFEVNAFPAGPVRGRFEETWGSFDLDWVHPSNSRLKIVAKSHSIRTQSSIYDMALQSAEFFDATRHPLVIFESLAIELTEPRSGTVTGSLAIRGITRKVTFPFTLSRHEGADLRSSIPRFQVSGSLRRSDWGMLALIPVISDDVEIAIHTGC